ncbi:MAG TPA: thiamine phosphate synthase [Kaistiaceae bacterium]|nr:thiamine phosphate synthase [Kaistiaceae bacterium]
MMKRKRNPLDLRLYGLVDPARTSEPDLAAAARAAVAGGATILQYRDKNASTRELVARAHAIKAALAGTGVPLLINDRADVAFAVGADGVHLGQDDLDPATARQLLGDDAIIGQSIKSHAHVAAAPLDLLDYVCIGGVFGTASKDNPDPPVGTDGLARLVAAMRGRDANLPVGAIAGITAGNAAAVIAAGADGIAVISDIFMAADIAGAAAQLRAIVDEALAARRAK